MSNDPKDWYRDGQTEAAAKNAGLWQRNNAPHNVPPQQPGESWESYTRREQAQKTGH